MLWLGLLSHCLSMLQVKVIITVILADSFCHRSLWQKLATHSRKFYWWKYFPALHAYYTTQKKNRHQRTCVSCNYFLPHPQQEVPILQILLLYDPYKLNSLPSPWTTSKDWLHESASKQVAPDFLPQKYCDTPLKWHKFHFLPFTATLLSGDCDKYRCEFQLNEYLAYQWLTGELASQCMSALQILTIWNSTVLSDLMFHF